MSGEARIIRGDALALPIAAGSVDLIVTSPPYFGLRSYQDGGEHYDGQIGDEATPDEFIDALIAATAEMVRVLKPEGSIWVNLGDKYNAYNGNRGDGQIQDNGPRPSLPTGSGLDVKDIRPKSLIGVPWRYAIRCIDELGLILRAEVIWSKPNGLPESVTDRVRRSHETWFAFQKSGGIEAAAQGFPFCPLCGRPVDARSSLVKRLQELDGRVVSGNLPNEVGAHDAVQSERTTRADLDVRRVANSACVPVFGEGDVALSEDSANLLKDGVVTVEDEDSQVRVSVRGAGQADRAFPVDNAGEPRDVCECVGHPLIVNDEPWIPQELAADLMRRVADGDVDPQAAADYLSGDYVRSHSVWFHFTKQPRYFSAVDEIREPHAPASLARYAKPYTEANNNSGRRDQSGNVDYPDGMITANPLGKLPGSVWTIPTQPLIVPAELGIDHFAAFPMEWPRRIIRGWSPEGICVECGQGRRPVVGHTEAWAKFRQENGMADWHEGDDRASLGVNRGHAHGVSGARIGAFGPKVEMKGYACACDEPTADTTPAIVLDPFGGTGTTATVAKALGRHGISVDLSSDYCRLAQWRTNDPGELAKAAERPKPKPVIVPDGQEVLFP